MRSCLRFTLPSLLFAALPIYAQTSGQQAPDLPPVSAEQSATGLHGTVGSEQVNITVCSDSVIHVVTVPEGGSTSSPKPWMLDQKESCPGGKFTFTKNADNATLKTAQLQIDFSLSRGNILIHDMAGDQLLQESRNVPRTYEPVVLNGEHTFQVEDRFNANPSEGIYGLGQHQSGLFNYRGATVELGQNNTDVAIPFLVSNRGYAILWNTAALSYFDNRFPRDISLSSIAGKSIDYYFIYGPEMDSIIHQYRSMTGHTPLLPKWAYGFFQSKDKYISLDEILDVGKRYRDEHIPLDAIVQDWFWWKIEGDPIFNSNYHDVPADLEKLHQMNIHAMISAWALLDPRSENFKQMEANHFDVPGAHVYDPSNPAARDLYWKNLTGKLFAQGWDAFWLDSAEPEEYFPHLGDAILRNKTLAIGNGAEYTNVFPLLHTIGTQEHWKQDNDKKRVFLLTRSAFVGQQRVGATVWSGDVYSTWWALSKQPAAGLNFALSGYPYWTTDIGGYIPPIDGKAEEPDFENIYTRWFEFGTFCPIFRTHGHRPANELWSYKNAEPILVSYDKLRYRLMPYIYSLAWKVTDQDYTIQRPLIMDWRTDPKVANIGDQFMFGPALMVSPVLKANATKREVYLPESPAWYDFWTGETVKGNSDLDVEAPLGKLPLYVRAGSILPLGPEIEYAEQDPGGPIELRIYRGADGSFDLYEDSGDSYDYQKGMHAITPIHWDDRSGTLTIGKREGSFPGMPEKRQFRIVFVGKDHGAGGGVSQRADREIEYDGKEVRVAAH
ncbi:TIM-barrel domain-containing protein [Silvibacterium acidisoli]|uniref:TIM-barrel domain-containing protein n=1 Tax=Acidobacteriaceae bacterium ZG23-2 TaxID=2883246 RepID=UPI00406C0F86